jgi:hypothetical protein
MKTKREALMRILIFSLSLGLIAQTISANPGDDEAPIRLFATAAGAPIGIATSAGEMTINGRLLIGEQNLWGGELVQAPVDANLLLTFDDAAQVRLKRGAIARFSLARSNFSDGSNGRVLIATLIDGVATIDLRAHAVAYIETAGSIYTSSRGASFKLGREAGTTKMEALSGHVEVASQAVQDARKIAPLDDGGRPIAMRGKIQVRLRSTRSLQFQVTDEKDRPLPDIPVIITIGSTAHGAFGSGVASVTATTNANGIASVNLVGGVAQGSDSIVAEIGGSNIKWEGTIDFKKGSTPTWVKVAPVAAGLAGIGVWRATRNGDNNQPQPGLGSGGVTVKP